MGTEWALGSGYHVSKYSLTYELGSDCHVGLLGRGARCQYVSEHSLTSAR